MADTMTAKELASACNTDAKRMRRFIRSTSKSDSPIVSACGQGHRYTISAREAKALIDAWTKAHAPASQDVPAT